MKTYEFSKKGMDQANGYSDYRDEVETKKIYKVAQMGLAVAVMASVGIVGAVSGAIVVEAAFPISGAIGKLVVSGFAFKTVLTAL